MREKMDSRVRMAFRANEDGAALIEDAEDYLIGREFPKEWRKQAQEDFRELVARFGPVVNGYPSWHPLVAAGNVKREPWTHPTQNRNYGFLDHTVLFRDAFLVCPYTPAQKVIDSVRQINDPNHFLMTEELDVKLYHEHANPVVVYCEWPKPILNDGTIPKSIAVPLLLEFELPHWRTSEVGETWETMRSYILGTPNGKSSSLFINKETGTVLKNVWNTIIHTGMFGPLYVG